MDGLLCCDKSKIIDISEIALVILDLDGTLYDIRDVESKVYETEVEFFSKEKSMSRDIAVALFEKNFIFPKITSASKSATEFFIQQGIDKKQWELYRNKVDYSSEINLANAVKQECINKLKTKYRLVLLSSNTARNIKMTLARLQIDEDIFDDILCSSNAGKVFSKGLIIENYCYANGISIEKTLSIGDRVNTDIAPLVKLGAIGVLLLHPTYFGELVNMMESCKLHTVEDRYYTYIDEKRCNETNSFLYQ